MRKLLIDTIMAWCSPKARVRVVIRVNSNSVYALQNQVRTFGIPGVAHPLPGGGGLSIEWEGREATLRKRLDDLAHNPLLSGNHSMQIAWLPYAGKRYEFFTIAF